MQKIVSLVFLVATVNIVGYGITSIVNNKEYLTQTRSDPSPIHQNTPTESTINKTLSNPPNPSSFDRCYEQVGREIDQQYPQTVAPRSVIREMLDDCLNGNIKAESVTKTTNKCFNRVEKYFSERDAGKALTRDLIEEYYAEFISQCTGGAQ
ncbi:hypothetical protein H6G80_03985 [Nostoc sp. FACHB-87]|uniref:hypothetical protein n=1 Tax=Nostocaceae TaxID=1162 RepID=UPI001686E0BC|nr:MULTISPECIES: hypothetical protein [Nostocaceae]MBD2453235.1 hypothetical protein [Nostoc sp. FACHB-87]MBD2474985.1 hypothetical protein [Anabaena sp. FACHB-83]